VNLDIPVDKITIRQYRSGIWDQAEYDRCKIRGGSIQIQDKDYDVESRYLYGYCVLRSDGIASVFEIDRVLSPGKRYHRAKRRAELYAQLWSDSDDLHSDTEGVIPISIAVEGKPAIAAYLFAVEEQNIAAISTQLGISTDTVWKYLRRFRDDDFD
jgi:hypothetical protein